MKEYTLEDRKIREFTLEDWHVNLGRLPKEPGYFGKSYDGCDRYISEETFIQIKQKIESDYWSSIDEGFQKKKQDFLKRHELSDDKDELLKREIKKYKKLFYSKESSSDIVENGWDIPFKKVFEEIIVNGQRIIDGNLRANHWQVEHFWKYYQWLKAIKESSGSPEVTEAFEKENEQLNKIKLVGYIIKSFEIAKSLSNLRKEEIFKFYFGQTKLSKNNINLLNTYRSHFDNFHSQMGKVFNMRAKSEQVRVPTLDEMKWIFEEITENWKDEDVLNVITEAYKHVKRIREA